MERTTQKIIKKIDRKTKMLAKEHKKTLEYGDNAQSREKIGKKAKYFLGVILSLAVGAINGLFGGGGGMLVVPLLTLLMGLDEKRAHSGAILVILPLSLVSGIIYLVRGDFTLYEGGLVSAGVILGGIIGTFAMKKLSDNTLAIIFYAIMIAAGISMFVGAINRG